MFNKTRSFISGILLGFYLINLTLTSGLQSGETTPQGINDGLVYVVGEDGAKIFYDATSVIGAGALVKGGIKGAVKSIGKKNPTGQLDEVIEQGAKQGGMSVADDATKHATERMLERGISSSSIDDAISNPLSKSPVKYDSLGRPSEKIIGKETTVIRNPNTNKIITTYPTSSKIVEKLGGNK